MTIRTFTLAAVAATATLASSLLPLTAQACGGCNIKFNGVTLNGISLNGVAFNDLKWNGLLLNGWTLNGISLQGLPVTGFTDNHDQAGRPVAVTLPNGRVVPVR